MSDHISIEGARASWAMGYGQQNGTDAKQQVSVACLDRLEAKQLLALEDDGCIGCQQQEELLHENERRRSLYQVLKGGDETH